MIRHTANYSNTNHNFVIQNLSEITTESEFSPAICIIKNILQRGKPTLLSKFLIKKIGDITKESNFNEFTTLVSSEKPVWENIIRGDVKKNNFPAKRFFDELIPKYFSEFKFLQQLIIPEVPINFITQIEVDEFVNQQVDFYLPQAFLVIEIDGSHHKEKDIKLLDELRDVHLKKYGIETYRFSTKEIETQSDDFLSTIKRIKSRINKVSTNIDNKNSALKNEEFVPSINNYENSINQDDDKRIIATAIIRFQLLILDMLEFGCLNFNQEYALELKSDFQPIFEILAIEDLEQWFINIFQLLKIKSKFPKINVKRVHEFSDITKCKIDFSLRKRYTDEFCNYPEIIFVRNDYFDHYLYYSVTDAVLPKIVGFKPFDFFKISSSKPIKYKFKFQNNGVINDESALGFVMDNLFGYNSFREGQLSIIANALQFNSTLGLLPTGGGKSICFQLPIFLQPGISFVVCPIKALMFDQVDDLKSRMITRVTHITSEDSGVKQDKLLNDFSNGSYQFIFIAPERFQKKTFRNYLQKLRESFMISYAVIDEVHCLSEWGHDFRTSYLNLSKTITKYCPSTKFIALSATASLNVLKDIKLELNIKDEDVKTLTDYSRPELDFVVVNDNDRKYNELKKILNEENNNHKVFELSEEVSHAGIIFTNNVNGSSGCANISRRLTFDLDFKVEFFCGSAPKINGVQMQVDEFEAYKHSVQKNFKANELPLIVATKAFGMGVNKNNVSYTIHFGIPGSMESLYQEAGRAGRDKQRYLKNHARCYVLFTKGENTEILDSLWDQNIPIGDLKKAVQNIDGDLKSNFFMLQSSLEEEETEFKIIKLLLIEFATPNKKGVVIDSNLVKIKIEDINGDILTIGSKSLTEKAIYRLTQLGIVEDWTVKNFFNGVFEVDFTDFNEDSVEYSLKETISKYSDKNMIDNILKNEFKNVHGLSKIDKCVYSLIKWVNKHFVYNRKQSLKNIYEACKNFEKVGFAKQKIEFKKKLENYFKFNESSFILQHIAENSLEVEKWFEVFYVLETSNQSQIRIDKLIDKEELKKLQDNLSRFLESYADNIGLNFISGLVRLLNNDFDNSDGKKRFIKTIEFFISNSWKLNNINQKIFIIDETCKIVRSANSTIKNEFSSFIIDKIGDDYELILLINKHLDDEITSSYLIKKLKKKLSDINKSLHEQIKRIG